MRASAEDPRVGAPSACDLTSASCRSLRIVCYWGHIVLGVRNHESLASHPACAALLAGCSERKEQLGP